MDEVSPFAAFLKASPDDSGSPTRSGSEGSAGGPTRVVGFERSPSSSEALPRAGSIAAERQPSLGGLNQLFREQQQRQQAELQAPRPRLTIQTTRSGKLTTSTRVKRVPRIQEDRVLAAADAAGGGEEINLGTTAPSRAPLAGLVRACSDSIDMPARLSKAQTAPEGIPDSLIIAAMATSYVRSNSGGNRSPTGGSNRSPTGGSAFIAVSGLPGTMPSRSPLHPQQQAQAPQQQSMLGQQQRSSDSDSSSSTSGGTGATSSHSSRPPMPVTPAFAALRAGNSQQQRGSKAVGPAPQRQGSVYKDLFDAQAETSMAQAQVSGLQEALRREHEQVSHLQQELEKALSERNMLRDAMGSQLTSASSAGTVFDHRHGHHHVPPAFCGATLAGAGHHAPAPLSRLAPVRGAAACRGGLSGPAGQAQGQLLPQAGLASGMHLSATALPPQQQGGQASPPMVSAFANAMPFSFD